MGQKSRSKRETKLMGPQEQHSSLRQGDAIKERENEPKSKRKKRMLV